MSDTDAGRSDRSGHVLHLLGTGGWMPSGQRETSCFMIRRGTRVLILDAGTGIRRLATQPSLLEGVERIDIALSHFHLDHLVGLSYLDAIGTGIEKVVWGPGRAAYGVSTIDILNRILAPPFSSAARQELFTAVKDIDMAGEQIGPHPVTVRVQDRHTHPSVSFRYADLVAYCTDTAFDADNGGLARGVRLLLHEAWLTGPTGSASHSTASEAARVALMAEAQALILVHLDPRAEHDLLLAESRSLFTATDLGRDGLAIPLGAS
ncbi:MBL fold metallo-hydrolase [Micromonospora violae]|uniref:MBL fold metallo-hydrolase n=1 Tax=Micromonospora violae TaxID=1278207 RepID=UPI0033F9F17D